MEKIQIAHVTCLGDYVKSNDEFYEYFDMYSTNKIKIDHILSRGEIIEIGLQMPIPRLIRFIQGFRLTEEEIKMIRFQYEWESIIQKALSYYQEGKKDVFMNPSKQKLKSIMK